MNATGLAHLFEHMMFRGTTNYKDGEFDRILTQAGADNQNASTWLDRTNYYESVPSDQLELVMRLESDRMRNLVIDQALLDTERSAVLGELGMCLDDPDLVASDKLYELAYRVHPYRYSTIGTEKEIKGFSKEDALYFYDKYYAPNNAELLIVGDTDPGQARDLALKYYGDFASREIRRFDAPKEPPQKSEKRGSFSHPQLTEKKLILGYHTPEVRHPDHAALLVAQAALSLGEGALLEHAWVSAGLAVALHGSLNQLREPGLMVFSADLQDGHDPEELIRELDRALDWLKATMSVEQAGEVERARNQVLLDHFSCWDENGPLASFIGEFMISADDPLFAFELTRAIEKVSSLDVARVVDQYLKPANRTAIVGSPLEERA